MSKLVAFLEETSGIQTLPYINKVKRWDDTKVHMSRSLPLHFHTLIIKVYGVWCMCLALVTVAVWMIEWQQPVNKITEKSSKVNLAYVYGGNLLSTVLGVHSWCVSRALMRNKDRFVESVGRDEPIEKNWSTLKLKFFKVENAKLTSAGGRRWKTVVAK